MTSVPTPPRHHDLPAGTAVWTRRLTKRYGGRTAVDHLDLQVPMGALSGFVGPNGAGKSTTLRMLLGLIRPTEGTGFVLGEPVAHPVRYLHRVGAMIEGPTFHPGLSGRANLAQLAALRRLDRRRADEALAMVNLTGRADDTFSSYSLGMKQRLGIAAALLPDPELVILDEPTNGLDPAGIREIRTLLQQLAGAGMTVFVSSHLLSEVEQVCDHVVMIRNGQLLFQGHVTDLLAVGDPHILMCPERDGDARRLLAVLADAGMRAEIKLADPSTVTPSAVDRRPVVIVHAPEGMAADLNRRAMRAGIALRSLRTHRPGLEETFLRVTGSVDGDLTRSVPAGRAGAGTQAGAGADRGRSGSPPSPVSRTGADP
jgi:ABC-2 type transport system ATP-binding protein